MSILSDRLDEDSYFEETPEKRKKVRQNEELKSRRSESERVRPSNNSQSKPSRSSSEKQKAVERRNESSDVSQKRKKSTTTRKVEVRDAKELKAHKETVLTEEDRAELEKIMEMSSDEAFKNEEKRNSTIKKISQIIMIVACSYLVMLIYGTFVTEYQYDSNGEVAPVVLSVSEIAERNEFLTLVGLYMEARAIYGDILVLDYRVSSGIEDTLTIAPHYETSIDTVEKIAIQIDAAKISSKYNQVREMLYYFVSSELMSYCRYMSTAISQNDAGAAQEALAGRSQVLNSFTKITENMITLGGEIRGYDTSDIRDWSPDGYVLEAVEGVS